MAAVVAGVCAWAPSSAAAVDVHVSGRLTITWHEEAGRGCAAAGVCEVTGSIQIAPEGSSSGSPGVPIEVFDQTAVARTAESSDDGSAPVSCADAVPTDFTFAIRGGNRAVVANQFGPGGVPSAGRCAGPTAADLTNLALPARHTSYGYDLSGNSSFGAGPFTVTAVSSLRVRITRSHDGSFVGPFGGGHGGARPKRRTILVESAEVDYAVAAVHGSLSIAYSGLADPACAAFGTCGASGQVTGQLSGAHGQLSIVGTRIVKRRVGKRTALADLRAGRLSVFGDSFGVSLGANMSAMVTAPRVPGCSDRWSVPALGLSSTIRHGVEQLTLLSGANQFFNAIGPDPLRSRCPGPTAADVLGSGPLEAARLPLSSLGEQTVGASFSGAGAFSALSYSGTRSASATLQLRLVRVRAGTSRETVVGRP